SRPLLGDEPWRLQLWRPVVGEGPQAVVGGLGVEDEPRVGISAGGEGPAVLRDGYHRTPIWRNEPTTQGQHQRQRRRHNHEAPPWRSWSTRGVRAPDPRCRSLGHPPRMHRDRRAAMGGGPLEIPLFLAATGRQIRAWRMAMATASRRLDTPNLPR